MIKMRCFLLPAYVVLEGQLLSTCSGMDDGAKPAVEGLSVTKNQTKDAFT